MRLALATILLAATTHPAMQVGPLFAGESLSAVRRLLGAGSPISICQSGTPQTSHCIAALAYRDGKNLLRLVYDAGSIETIEIDFDVPRSNVASAHVATGAFRSWRWNGRAIDRLPDAPIPGWTGAPVARRKGCYGELQGPPQASGADLTVSFACPDQSDRVATFKLGLVDP